MLYRFSFAITYTYEYRLCCKNVYEINIDVCKLHQHWLVIQQAYHADPLHAPYLRLTNIKQIIFFK